MQKWDISTTLKDNIHCIRRFKHGLTMAKSNTRCQSTFSQTRAACLEAVVAIPCDILRSRASRC
eukprot:7523312-Karenia_brevis.AAC.1